MQLISPGSYDFFNPVRFFNCFIWNHVCLWRIFGDIKTSFRACWWLVRGCGRNGIDERSKISSLHFFQCLTLVFSKEWGIYFQVTRKTFKTWLFWSGDSFSPQDQYSHTIVITAKEGRLTFDNKKDTLCYTLLHALDNLGKQSYSSSLNFQSLLCLQTLKITR